MSNWTPIEFNQHETLTAEQMNKVSDGITEAVSVAEDALDAVSKVLPSTEGLSENVEYDLKVKNKTLLWKQDSGSKGSEILTLKCGELSYEEARELIESANRNVRVFDDYYYYALYAVDYDDNNKEIYVFSNAEIYDSEWPYINVVTLRASEDAEWNSSFIELAKACEEEEGGIITLYFGELSYDEACNAIYNAENRVRVDYYGQYFNLYGTYTDASDSTVYLFSNSEVSEENIAYVNVVKLSSDGENPWKYYYKELLSYDRNIEILDAAIETEGIGYQNYVGWDNFEQNVSVDTFYRVGDLPADMDQLRFSSNVWISGTVENTSYTDKNPSSAGIGDGVYYFSLAYNACVVFADSTVSEENPGYVWVNGLPYSSETITPRSGRYKFTQPGVYFRYSTNPTENEKTKILEVRLKSGDVYEAPAEINIIEILKDPTTNYICYDTFHCSDLTIDETNAKKYAIFGIKPDGTEVTISLDSALMYKEYWTPTTSFYTDNTYTTVLLRSFQDGHCEWYNTKRRNFEEQVGTEGDTYIKDFGLVGTLLSEIEKISVAYMPDEVQKKPVCKTIVTHPEDWSKKSWSDLFETNIHLEGLKPDTDMTQLAEISIAPNLIRECAKLQIVPSCETLGRLNLTAIEPPQFDITLNVVLWDIG